MTSNEIASHILTKHSKERKAILQKYLDTISFEDEITKALNALFYSKDNSGTFLPSNPYLSLIDHFRIQEVLYKKQSDLGVKINEVTATDSITNLNDKSLFWGVKSIMKFVDIQTLNIVHESIRSAHGVVQENTASEDGYDITECSTIPVGTVVNSCGHSSLKDLKSMQHFFVVGPKLEKAITFFAHKIIKDIFDALHSGLALVKGVNVIIPPRKKSEEGDPRLWTLDELKTSRSAFISAVKAAVVSKKKCYVEGLLVVNFQPRSENYRNLYINFRKEYLLYYSQHSKDGFRVFSSNQNEGIHSFHQNLFFTEQSANFYFNYVQKTPAFVSAKKNNKKSKKIDDSAVIFDTSAKQDAIARHYKIGDYRLVWQELLEYAIFMNSNNSELMINSLNAFSMEIPEKMNQIRVRLRAFLESIKFCQEFVLSFDMDKSNVITFPAEVNISESNSGNEGLLNKYIDISIKHYRQLRVEIQLVLDLKISSLVQGLKAFLQYNLRIIDTHLDNLLDCLYQTVGSSRHNPLTIVYKAIHEIIVAFQVIELSISRDVARAAILPKGEKKIGKIDYSNLVMLLNYFHAVVENKREHDLSSKKKIDQVEINEISFNLIDSWEAPEYMEGNKELVVNTNLEIRKALVTAEYPRAIIKESIYMRYMVDSRVDQALEECITTSLTEGLLDNPYIRFVEILNNYGIRHLFWSKSSKEINKEIGENKLDLVMESSDAILNIYRITLLDHPSSTLPSIYGFKCLLKYVDSSLIVALYDKLIDGVIGCDYQNKNTAYSLKVISALGGAGLLLSLLRKKKHSHIGLIEVIDDYIVEGRSLQTGAEIFVDCVIHNVLSLIKDINIFVKHIALGDEGDNWEEESIHSYSAVQVKLRRDAFRADVAKTAMKKQVIAIHILFPFEFDGCIAYIPMSKHYHFQFISHPSDTVHSFYNEKVPWDFTRIFFAQKDAEYVLNCLPKACPSSAKLSTYTDYLKTGIQQAASKGDYFQLYSTLFQLLVVGFEENELLIGDFMRMITCFLCLISHMENECVVINEAFEAILASEEGKNQIDLKILHQQVEKLRNCIAQDILGSKKLAHFSNLATCSILLDLVPIIPSANDLEDINDTCRENLFQLQVFLKCIRYSLAYHVHQNCPRVDAELKGILSNTSICMR